jgi:hypothetical protein
MIIELIKKLDMATSIILLFYRLLLVLMSTNMHLVVGGHRVSRFYQPPLFRL